MATRTEQGAPAEEGRFPGDAPAPESITQPRLSALGWARWAWRQLTSMRTALLLLMLLAVAAVPGSMLPQRRADPGAVQDYLDGHPGVGPWLDRIGAFDVFTSAWFSAIYLLLFVSLVGCVLPRSRLHLRALRAAPPRTPRRLERLPAHHRVHAPSGHTPEQALADARNLLRRKRYRIADQPTNAGPEGGVSLAAERGYLAETGNLIFHLALVGLLGALAWGSLASYSGQATVVEGRSFANVLPSYDSFAAGRLVEVGELPPFSLTLDRMDVAFETQAGSQLGAPRRFDATLTVRDRPGAPPRTLTVRPNQPLDIDGTRAFLVGNGYAPAVTVRDGNGDVAFRGPVITNPIDGNYKSVIVIKAPDAAPRQIGLAGVFVPTYDLDEAGTPVSLFPDPVDPKLVLLAHVSQPGRDGLGVDGGQSQSVFRLDTRQMTALKGPDGEQLRMVIEPGATATLPDGAGSVTFEGFARYAALDIRRDPSRLWALVFSALALAGVTASLFVRRRRLWVRAVAEPDGTTVIEVAGLARGDDAGLGPEVRTLAMALDGAAGHGAGHGGGRR